MVVKLKCREDFESLLLGATIYATGGGGDPKRGMMMVKEVFLDKGRELLIYDVEELNGNEYIVSPYFLGSAAPKVKVRKEVRINNPIARALEIYMKKLNMKVGAFIPVELGGGNTAVALYAAGLVGLPVVDGDRVGRAAPEVHQDTIVLFSRSMTPAVTVTPTGNELVILGYADIDDYEAILRHLSILAGSHTLVLDAPIRASEAKEVVIRGSLSKCLELGRKVIEAKRKGVDVAKVAAEAMNGWIIFKGAISKWIWRSEGGFLLGELEIEGTDEYKGRVLRSWIKNEHIMVWIDSEPVVMPPDLFTLITDKGDPLINRNLEVGLKVTGIAAPAPKIWRTSKGLELFGPKHFGFKYDYVPVEKLVEKHAIT